MKRHRVWNITVLPKLTTFKQTNVLENSYDKHATKSGQNLKAFRTMILRLVLIENEIKSVIEGYVSVNLLKESNMYCMCQK